MRGSKLSTKTTIHKWVADSIQKSVVICTYTMQYLSINLTCAHSEFARGGECLVCHKYLIAEVCITNPHTTKKVHATF